MTSLPPPVLGFLPTELVGPWQIAVLPHQPVPPESAVGRRAVRIASALHSVLQERIDLRAQSFLQVWTFAPGRGSEQLEASRTTWDIQLGLGIWPDREPPGGWTDEKMQNAAAAMIRGDQPKLPSYRLLRVDPRSGNDRSSILNLHATGNVLHLFSKVEAPELDRHFQQALQSKVEGTDFASQRFYVPLMDRQFAIAAGSSGVLNALLGPVDLYLRDSAEDGGILLISRLPIQPLLAAAKEELS